MRNFFRALEGRGAEYLVTSGQAAVLYGGAMFSEDLDLWVRPTRENAVRIAAALRDVAATVYKLTPPLVPRYWNAGHAFHFRIGDAYVDLMFRPPRVGAFGVAARRAVRLATDWGVLPVVSVEDLVEMKKTRRPADYVVITRLALVRLRREESGGRPRRRVLRWVVENLFGRGELLGVLARWDVARELGRESGRRAARLAASSAPARRVESAIASELKALRDADRRYWQPIVRELAELRGAGRLLTEGSRVSSP